MTRLYIVISVLLLLAAYDGWSLLCPGRLRYQTYPDLYLHLRVQGAMRSSHFLIYILLRQSSLPRPSPDSLPRNHRCHESLPQVLPSPGQNLPSSASYGSFHRKWWEPQRRMNRGAKVLSRNLHGPSSVPPPWLYEAWSHRVRALVRWGQRAVRFHLHSCGGYIHD